MMLGKPRRNADCKKGKSGQHQNQKRKEGGGVVLASCDKGHVVYITTRKTGKEAHGKRDTEGSVKTTATVGVIPGVLLFNYCGSKKGWEEQMPQLVLERQTGGKDGIA